MSVKMLKAVSTKKQTSLSSLPSRGKGEGDTQEIGISTNYFHFLIMWHENETK